ncbi:photosynthetic NDH subunit of subcomplex B 3, chloroplastic [Andrographis paniculata]|uniref:photosynthetic NDH subunit of subcomplex B 3, chloroplastic n=1 Tax=Andrographis paniculata TaxID=175694 RepID=UPI0021E7DD22|nr:photosynthetic NDH subunit of subcomplex B 3, chloroplastic [Andrographis paniculata]
MSLSPLSFCPPEFRTNRRISAAPVSPTKRLCISLASASSTSQPEKPEIELEFLGPNPGDAVNRTTAISGEKLLRNIMLDNKIELYAVYGKLMNCGGGGSCGTCIVEIINGKDLLNERTNTELRYLKKKPESWRLACQTIVGNKENSGKVVVQRLPQRKK